MQTPATSRRSMGSESASEKFLHLTYKKTAVMLGSGPFGAIFYEIRQSPPNDVGKAR